MEENLTMEDAIYFLDLIDSTKSPNFVPRMFKPKPYFKLLKDKHSIDYNRFINIYKMLRHLLTDRQSIILDYRYGVNKERESLTLSMIGEKLSLSPERIRQIIYKAEIKLANGVIILAKANT